MKIGTFQFAVTADMKKNEEIMTRGIREAAELGISLLAFPECALTGYPPRDLPGSDKVDFAEEEAACKRLHSVCEETGTAVLLGTIEKEEEQIFNRAVFLAPGGVREVYDKRALWGWDRDNFSEGTHPGVIDYKGFRIGVRICFEIRFPEYFRELYKEQTDLDIVLFYDVSDKDDEGRYNMIRAHIQTRAVENVCTFLTADAISPYQTAPTAVFGRSGQVEAECVRNREGLVCFDLQKRDLDFGEKGRREITDRLSGMESSFSKC